MVERRSFLKKLMSTALLAAVPLPAFAAGKPKEPEAAPLFTDTRLMMGTFVSITVSGVEEGRATEAVHSAFAAMAHAEALLTRFDASSALGQLNGAGMLNDIPQELAHVVKAAALIHAQTGGAFDPTVLPVLEVLESRNVQRGELEEARQLIGMGRVRCDSRSIRFERGGMRMSLDAIAKGHIADIAAQSLLSSGLGDFLVNAGGDIVAHGSKAGRPWRVAIENPGRYEGRTAYPAVCSLSGKAMATSGNYESAGRGFRHLIDPLGRDISAPLSATVVAPTAMEADALATALCLMPDPMAFIEARPHTACCLVTAEGVRCSSRWTS